MANTTCSAGSISPKIPLNEAESTRQRKQSPMLVKSEIFTGSPENADLVKAQTASGESKWTKRRQYRLIPLKVKAQVREIWVRHKRLLTMTYLINQTDGRKVSCFTVKWVVHTKKTKAYFKLSGLLNQFDLIFVSMLFAGAHPFPDDYFG